MDAVERDLCKCRISSYDDEGLLSLCSTTYPQILIPNPPLAQAMKSTQV